VLLDAGGHERVRDLHEQRGRPAEQQEQLAVQPPGDRTLGQDRVHYSSVRSFGFALEGLAYLARTQRNFRIHLLLALAAVAAGVAFGLSAVEWAILIVTIALVIMTEGLNTGIEFAVSLASPDRRPEAKAAKDIAAGVVLLAAIASVAVGIALFGSRVIAHFRP
jgi:diacylglycerol kinase (ATP)